MTQSVHAGQVLVESGVAHRELPTVTALFEEQAELNPSGAAVIADNQTLSYGELNWRAARIACWLRDSGVQPSSVVAVCVERTVDLPAAVLGVLKAGAAFLPIDPALPKDRIQFMVEESEASLLVTSHAFAPMFQYLDKPVLTLEQILLSDAPASGAIPARGDLAYVIYTSGSTGKPKGVEILHPGLANFLQAMRTELNFEPGDRMLAHSSFSFDVALFEFFLPLCTGGTIVLVSRATAAQSDALRRVVESSGLSVMLGTPTTWQILMNSGWQGDSNLTAICGGEILPVALGRRLSSLTRALWNHYGPSETTIAATTYRVRGDEPRYPIGRVLPNLEAFVCDPSGQLVPGGGEGELYISGIGVARGYRNRPELTEAKFVELTVPGSGQPKRAYRTGDLVRFLPDGNLEFIGRADNQVKVRGFRIELEEIETALCQFPGISQCAVLALDRGDSDRTLVAFYERKSGKSLTAAEISAFLRERLPIFMVPGTYLGIPELPITHNGKIDRGALQTRAKAHFESAALPLIEDVHSLEESLRDLWRRTLGHDEITLDSNFFELGGTSIMANALMGRVQRRFGLLLPLAIFFEAPTIARMAQLISDSGWAPSWSPLVRIKARGSRPPVFCIHALGGNVLIFQYLAAHLGPDQPVYGIQARGLSGNDLPHDNVEAMATDYLSFIRKLVPDGPYFLAGYSSGGVVAFEMARQLIAGGTPPALLVILDSDIKSPGPAGPRPSLLSRIRANPRARFESFWRNRKRKFEIASVKLRINTRLGLKKAGFKIGPLRAVDDAFVLAVQRYTPRPAVCDTILFNADKGPGDDNPDITMGWSALIPPENLTVVKIAGQHNTMLYDPFVAEVAGSISARIDQVLNAHSRQSVESS